MVCCLHFTVTQVRSLKRLHILGGYGTSNYATFHVSVMCKTVNKKTHSARIFMGAMWLLLSIANICTPLAVMSTFDIPHDNYVHVCHLPVFQCHSHVTYCSTNGKYFHG